MLFLLFRYKGWEPSKYYWMPAGEQKIIRAFMEKEIEERNKEIDSINNSLICYNNVNNRRVVVWIGF